MLEGQRERPTINTDVAQFWDGVQQHRFLIQRCDGCGSVRFPWIPACGACGSDSWHGEQAAGTGRIYSWVTTHTPLPAGVTGPFTTALVELDEGVRAVGLVHEPDGIRIGAPVEVDFTRDGDFWFPDFRLARG